MDQFREDPRGQGDTRMIQDAYTRIALRLRDLSPADREWLLGQLAPEDCRRVTEALRLHRAQTLAVAARATERQPSGERGNPQWGSAGKSPAGDRAPDEANQDVPVNRLMAAPPPRVKALLGEQPDWAIALVLSAESWPWTQEFLGDLVPERIRALRAQASELAPCVKPKFRQAVVRAIESKMQPATVESPVTVAFDTALERALNDLPVLKYWPSDRV